MSTNISWTDETWNPFVGCSKVSEGCANCYAIQQAKRNEAMAKALIEKGKNPGRLVYYIGLTKETKNGTEWTGKVNFVPEAIDVVFNRKKPTKWFVNSMSDLFHKSISFDDIDKVMAAIALTPHHTYQVLTKRPERMLEYFEYLNSSYDVDCSLLNHVNRYRNQYSLPMIGVPNLYTSPRSNLWLGVTVEDQKQVDQRIPYLLQTPAKIRFLSCEPLLEEIDISEAITTFFCTRCDWAGDNGHWNDEEEIEECPKCGQSLLLERQFTDIGNKIDWVIIGGESGHKSRPFHLEWAQSLIEQCQEAGVKVWFKQAGSNPCYQGKPLKLKSKNGTDLSELPEFCQVQEMPIN